MDVMTMGNKIRCSMNASKHHEGERGLGGRERGGKDNSGNRIGREPHYVIL